MMACLDTSPVTLVLEEFHLGCIPQKDLMNLEKAEST